MKSLLRLLCAFHTACFAHRALRQSTVETEHDDHDDHIPFAHFSVATNDSETWYPLRSGLRMLQRERSPACGSPASGTDCNRSYKVAEIEMLATSPKMADAKKKQLHLHQQAREACLTARSINDHGGWCYQEPTRVVPKANADVPFQLPSHHVEADAGFVHTLSKEIFLRDDGTCCASVTDLGAGVGQFGHALRANQRDLEYHGYDGAGNVEEFTENYVMFADLTQPLYAKRTDWVISSEVGEHIPNQFEKQVIANIHALNCKGVVLTWAVLGQEGHGHVNNHSNEYLIRIFEELGYTLNTTLTSALRRSVTDHPYLSWSAMVFVRRASACSV